MVGVHVEKLAARLFNHCFGALEAAETCFGILWDGKEDTLFGF